MSVTVVQVSCNIQVSALRGLKSLEVTLVASLPGLRQCAVQGDNRDLMGRSGKAAMIFLFIFSLPFCGFGIAAALKGIRLLTEDNSGGPWVLIGFGIVFSTIGFALMTAAIFGPRKVKQAQRRQLENAEQPWLWRDDWAQGRANSRTKSEMTRAWIYTVLWNLIALPILFVVPEEKFQQQPASLLALAFPLIGVVLLIWAIRETVRWFEFGITYFQMSSVPCVIGRELRGAVQTHFPRPPAHDIRLKLTCVNHMVTGSGKTQTVQDKILWQDEQSVAPGDLYPGPDGTNIPVRFQIPLDSRSTDTTDPRNSITWQLEADADVPGVDYKDNFELPVFRTKDTPSTEQLSAFAPTEPSAVPFKPTIVVRTASEGGTEFYFPAARNPGFASGLTGFCLLWSGMLWFMIAKHAPFIFPAVFGVFELLLGYGALQLWLGTSRVVIGAESVRVRRGLLGTGSMQLVAFHDVAKIQTAITSQQGGGSSGVPYYDIQLVPTHGSTITLGQTVRDKHEAESLVAEMTRLITPKALAADASR